jgi:hypothetical protein
MDETSTTGASQNLFWNVEGQPALLFSGMKHLSIVLYETLLLEVDLEVRSRGVTDFISSLPQLESLLVRNWRRIPDGSLWAILSVQGATLRQLHLHDCKSLEPQSFIARSSMITIDRLQAIRNRCSHLQEISIDIRSSEDGTFERALFTELSLFPNLSTVNLTFNSGENLAMMFRGWPRSHNPSVPDNWDDVPTMEEKFASNPFQRIHPGFAENIRSAIRGLKMQNNTTPLKRVRVIVFGQKQEGKYNKIIVTQDYKDYG